MRQIAFLAGPVLIAAVSLSAADPTLVNMVMPDAKVMAGINVERAKTSPFGQFLLNSLPQDSEFQKFIVTTGFDPRKDVAEVLMASTTTSNHGIVMVRGSFDVPRILAEVAKEAKHTSEIYAGAQLIADTNPKSTGAMAFVQSNIAVIGDVDSVKAALDRRGGTNAIDPALAAKVSSFSGADAWSVSIAPMDSFGNGAPKNVQGPAMPFNMDVLKTVQQSSGSVTLGSPIQISAEAVARTEQDASSLGDVVKLLLSMAQMGMTQPNQSAEASDMAALVRSLNVSTDHNTLKIGLAIPEDQLEKLIKQGPMQQHHKKPAGHADLE